MLSLYTNLQTLGFTAKNRLRGEKGATAVEYGIMVALIAVVIIVAVTFLSGSLSTLFQNTGCAITDSANPKYTPAASGPGGTCGPK